MHAYRKDTVIAGCGLERVAGAISKLESISFNAINTDKIKMIVERNDTTLAQNNKDGRIEDYSRQILASYSSVFGLSKCKEATII